GDALAAHVAAAGRDHLAAHRALAVVVDRDHRFDDALRRLEVLRGLEQRERVLGETATAIAWASVQELAADAVVETDASRHFAHVGADLLAKVRDLVDKGDLGREEGIARILGELGTAPAHLDQRRLAAEEQRPVNLAHALQATLVAAADDNAI